MPHVLPPWTGIVRLDSKAGRTHGWQARIYEYDQHRLRTVTAWTRFFSDALAGGRDKAYQLARQALLYECARRR